MTLNPRPIDPGLDALLGPHAAPERSLVEDLGELVDGARQLQTDLGLRPYRVFSVLQEWSGRVVGRGVPRIVREQEFLPTPFVDLRPVRTVPRNAGKVEEGQITLREVSPRYTEDQIAGLLFQAKLGPGQEGYVEIRHDARDGQQTRRRRFSVHGVPWRDAEEFEWVVRLVRARPDRTRAGQLNERTEMPERILNPLMAEEE